MLNSTKEEVIEDALKEIVQFEVELSQEQKEYMDTVCGGRHSDMKKNVNFPFLKSLHKVHKMSEDEVKRKDLSVLKFRPVVDAKNWLTRGFAEFTMLMIRKANNLLLMQCGPVMRKMKPKNGWRFAVDTGVYKVHGSPVKS